MIELKDLIDSRGFLSLSYALIHEFGFLEATFLSEIISQYNGHLRKGNIEEGEEFYCTIKKIENRIGMNRTLQDKAIDGLIAHGVIEKNVKGVPPKRFFTINEDTILEFVLNLDDEKVRKRLRKLLQKKEKEILEKDDNWKPDGYR